MTCFAHFFIKTNVTMEGHPHGERILKEENPDD
eukprot:CAMPEP_0172592378 /NCGR_PEP_ID=MMETSP1068-20121228/11340_1 /TAXON_ID=35684 /ORGANISM="Pseudopedinella elastica, Strain CCMP716" /LENGTH=32 /DNA_ID= /DNA_START= /DNA_END= /DNA_ORIENTATION=